MAGVGSGCWGRGDGSGKRRSGKAHRPGKRGSLSVTCSSFRFPCCHLNVIYDLSCKCMEFALYFMPFFVRLT